jgi:Putative methyltransferase
MRDWVAWHQAYADPASGLSMRLRSVQRHLSGAIDRAAAAPVRLVSLCAGQGHDVIEVLAHHPRRDEVSAMLVEAHPRNAELARCQAAAAGLAQVKVRQADASRPWNYADALPADVLLLCGIFGNVSDADVERTVAAAPALCAPAATVIWTRHRRPPDLTPRIRAWMTHAGFEEIAFETLDTPVLAAVGAGRLQHAAPSGLPASPLSPSAKHEVAESLRILHTMPATVTHRCRQS